MQNINKIIEEQKKEFESIAIYTNEYGYEHKIPKYDEVLEWYTSSLLQILQALKESEEKETTPAVSGQITDSDECCNCGEDLALELYDAFGIGYQEHKQDTINKLNDIIIKLNQPTGK